jgi:uncharacterized protein involved in outer membrane biogenesis
MKPGVRRFFRFLLIGIAGLFIAVLVGLLPLNVGFVKGSITSAVRAATGLELSIADPLILRLGANPGITTGGMTYGDRLDGRFVEVASLEGRLSLWALLSGRIHVGEARARGIYVNYCGPLPRAGEGGDGDASPPPVAVDDVVVSDVVIGCDETRDPELPEILISRIVGAAPQGADAEIDAEASIAGEAYSLNAVGGALNRLLSGEGQYPVSVRLESAQSAVIASARLSLPTAIESEVDARVSDLRLLLQPFGLEIPPVGTLALSGLLWTDFKRIDAEAFSGELGDSRFTFDAAIELSAERPAVRLEATLDNLDLAPFVDGEAELSGSGQSNGLPDTNLEPLFRGLAAVDAEFDVEARRVGGLPVDVAAVELAGSLDDGRLEMRSVAADVLGGRLSGSGLLDSRPACPELAFAVRADGVQLDTLNAMLPAGTQIGGGAESVTLEAGSCGQSIHEHRDSLAATLGLTRGGVSYNGKPVPLRAEKLEAVAAPGQRLTARLRGPFAGVPVDVVLDAGTPAAFWRGEAWPIDLVVDGGGSELSMKGRAALSRDNEFVDVAVEFDSPSLGTLHAWTGTVPEADLPLLATGRLKLDSASIVAEDLAVSLGASDLGGSIAWKYGVRESPVAVRLRSGHLDLAEVAAVFPSSEAGTVKRGEAASPEGPRTPGRILLPPINLDVQFDSVHARKLDLQEVALHGRLRSGLIDDARVSMFVEQDVELRGVFDFDVRTLPATASLRAEAENLDIGQLARRMGLERDVRMRADGIDIHVSTAGSTLQELVVESLIEAELRGFSWQIPRSVPGDEEHSAEVFDFSLDLLSLETAPDRPTNWTSSGQLDGVRVDLWLQTPSLVDAFDDVHDLPVKLVLAANDNVAMLDARIDRTSQNGLNGQAVLSGAVISRNGRSLEHLESPLQDYEFSSSVRISDRHLEFPDVQMRLGGSSASGSVTIVGGERRQIDMVLNAPRLQTDDLLYWSRDFRDAMLVTDVPETQSAVAEGSGADPDEAQPERRGILPMVGGFVETLQGRNDVVLSISIEDLAAGNNSLGGASLQLRIDENEFRLEPVEIVLPGGGVNAGYVARVADGNLEAELKVNADALIYGGLLRLADPESKARGLLFLDTAISVDTEMVPGKAPFNLLLENANGHFSIAAWPENLESGVLDLWSANVIVALLPAPGGPEVSRLNCLASNFEIREGIMKSTTSLLDTTDTIIRGRGTIDLGREQLDLLVWPQAKREKFLSVSTPVTVTGTFDDFSVGVEPGGFIGTVIRWYTSLIYVPFKWLTGERFDADGTSTCFDAMGWELTPGLHEYFLQRDFSSPPVDP